MNTNGITSSWYGYSSPKTTTKKTTTTKKKFDKDGKVVSETTTVVEESVTTYDYPVTYKPTITNGTSFDVKYGTSSK